MNFSIHLPQPLLISLDNFAKDHSSSRSGVVRDAVENYLAQKTASQWPADVLAWMSSPQDSSDLLGLPDFNVIRQESNDLWQSRSDELLKDFSS